MKVLFLIARRHVVDDIKRQALAAWRLDNDPIIVEFTDSERTVSLLNLVRDERVDLSNACFAIDAADSTGWADFSVFLTELRAHEKIHGRNPVVIRSLNCNVR